ncbi:YbfB/YjiJ family MFS transporter [Curvibacter sp. HBC61]|uniref:YbfB/YjiJ family MFS transporter n=1 Tax=Curvibacter cyanobacteriorum TaxID=3026422 RepID=A0ABT5N0F4_9BURK|nr:YbfB/YjiJ family MFS transporter [Curvibacter sp. HBC61]MDD0839567.1 YbfB/YjiJ family MFS transporter [Curvibacter sp. HBC61]
MASPPAAPGSSPHPPSAPGPAAAGPGASADATATPPSAHPAQAAQAAPDGAARLPATALALALSLGAAVSLGITRFSYGLLLPTMRADLDWSYALAGAMNTANALGYLLGALAMPALLRRHGPERLLLGGALLASGFMAWSGWVTEAGPLLLQRWLAGAASALVFVAGGLLAARLGTLQPRRAGWLLGLYYGGTGFGIVLSAFLVPAVLEAAAAQAHAWRYAWWALAAASLLASVVLAWPAQRLQQWLPAAPASAQAAPRLAWRPLAPALLGYTAFGVGYIGYMTFVIAVLREQGVSPPRITLFYALLGAAVLASSRLWAGLLDRARGGGALATLNALLGVAAIIPAWTAWWPALLASGLLFGGVFLSVVASTTALVRHNLPAPLWGAGITAFTVVFALGQILGPTAVGWIADGPGGLLRGLVFSALALWLGAGLAWRQKPLPKPV